MAAGQNIACIGRRDVEPHSMRCYLEYLGARYAEEGSTVCSGNADGSDDLFALGAGSVREDAVEVYLPWASYNRQRLLPGNKVWTAAQALPIHRRLAQDAHLRWDVLKDSVRLLMIRNAMIVHRFDKPVDLVVANPNTEKRGWGGTGHGITIAVLLGIPVFLLNLNRYLQPGDPV